MGTEILKSFGTLQSELEKAKSSLKGVDEDIKRLIGRDPSEFLNRPGSKRVPPNEDRTRLRGNKNRNTNVENSEPLLKRKKESVFKRLSEKPSPYEELSQTQKGLISKVIVTPREVPSRQDALAAQSKDVKFKERNRRMFGALLGTLQKFQQEETKLKQREDKRAQLEKKIEEHEIKEKAEIKKERQELFFNRKKKQAEIKMIELKMMRMKEYAIWEDKQKPLMNFIRSKSKPHIFYLPKRMDDKHRELLENSRKEIEATIEKKRQAVMEELQRIEDKMKKNFESKIIKGNTNEEIEKMVNEENPEDQDQEMPTEINFEEESEEHTENPEVSVKQDHQEDNDLNGQTMEVENGEVPRTNVEINNENDSEETVLKEEKIDNTEDTENKSSENCEKE